ncbi:MAG: extracellular solute-binding protein [Eubacteriales bacterium]|nr:extracellular solute-binding protein [Eubacteriales bacterium]
MKKMWKRVIACSLAGAMTLPMAVCAEQENASGNVPTITFYPRDANVSSGVVGGFKGEYFASRGFNLDVWSYSDEKTNAILASGDLPDVMFIPEQSLDIMIQNGMLLNLDEYLDDMPHLQAFEEVEPALNYVREFKSAGTGSVYGIPTSIGDNYARYKWVDSTERNAVRLRWDVYEEIGAPEINSMDDLIDVMEQMQEAHPTEEDGTPCYGTVLNNGSDSTYWSCMTMWYRMQGYLENQLPYLLETNMVEGTYTSILSRDSMYYQGLKWYNEVNSRGLMDPDSINNDRPTQKVKVDGGYAQVPSGYLPGWAPTYLEYLIPGNQVYYNYSSTYGDTRYMIGISAKTENLDACLAYLDMLADPDAYLIINSGPEGEYWYADGENAYFTDAALEWLNSGHGDYTGFALSTGETLEIWNTPFIIQNGVLCSYKDGEGNYRSASTIGWQEVNEISTDNEVFRQWQETTGFTNWKEWLESENAYTSESVLDDVFTFTSLPDDMMQLTIDAIKDKVVNASWKMVYAEDEAEFEAIWDQMVADCEGLGAQEIIEWRLADLENAMTTRDSLQ